METRLSRDRIDVAAAIAAAFLFVVASAVSAMNTVSPATTQTERRWRGAVSALLLRPAAARACFVFAHGAGAGMTHAFMERVCGRPLRPRHRDAALSVSLYGKGQQAAGCAGAGPCRGARRRRGGRARLPGARALCRRQIVRRPHDVAGAGHRAAGRRPRTCLPGLSPASGGQAFRRPGKASRGRPMSPCCSSRAPATSWPN